jgi:hypothetical protein
MQKKKNDSKRVKCLDFRISKINNDEKGWIAFIWHKYPYRHLKRVVLEAGKCGI